ncbi:hypothetical protein [Actinoplanes sp. RD1]|uniref:hypothetical protein n=1 Tax=Actinoplanes sp. RD1 TaxID=3064538 RepID=UPI0027412D85|nr:hypothetical protein [Actinoplanes sp. RD1]
MPPLMRWAGGRDAEVRKRCTVAVRHVAPEAAREVLDRLRTDPGPTVRWAAELQHKRLPPE